MADLVTTTINHSIPPADGIRAIQSTVKLDPISGERERNYTRRAREVQVENIRGREGTVGLDTAGFQFYTSPTKYKGEFLDDEEIKREYYPESEELIKKLTGASKVVIFDHSTYIKIVPILHHLLRLIISHSSLQTWADRRPRQAITGPAGSY